MQLIKSKISVIAREFWKTAGYNEKVPKDIYGAVNLVLPLDIINLSELSLRKIVLWLKKRNVTLNISIDDRALHGFILTYKGSGFIFINGTDSENERRYTVAHETSHFLLDYKIPRDRAIEKLGDDIVYSILLSLLSQNQTTMKRSYCYKSIEELLENLKKK